MSSIQISDLELIIQIFDETTNRQYRFPGPFLFIRLMHPVFFPQLLICDMNNAPIFRIEEESNSCEIIGLDIIFNIEPEVFNNVQNFILTHEVRIMEQID